MLNRFRRFGTMAAAAAMMLGAAPGHAYLYWTMPNFAGAAVKGDEPGIGQPMPGASTKELQAHLLWNMRAGLNVAALQCQFAPALMTVSNYNGVLYNHAKELTAAYNTLTAYFKRSQPKGWQVALDQYTTKTYNGFSTLHAQRGFCEVAGQIGRDALDQPKGKLFETAEQRMQEFRNSLVPQPETLFYFRQGVQVVTPADMLICRDRKGRPTPCAA